ncbi:Oidioi.mRNA.OKI2018_I69.PAR.g10977.t1.cds [Oikopleura dioica]|uniref:Oidioi.mRNA.OKI2018_I69.PAR.g10977.t1.cds n=1 Tax=Oikopleura dioica TaxID=34765 RepID=A0ABN7RX00_OIKDI|nr:Oidioi.mRNA.OKI2018_I69.PAR.g10977.t1.cds [Oikopleura dioica]
MDARFAAGFPAMAQWQVSAPRGNDDPSNLKIRRLLPRHWYATKRERERSRVFALSPFATLLCSYPEEPKRNKLQTEIYTNI